jgi:MFS family permease
MVLTLIVRAKNLGASSATVGLMLAFLGGGAIVGALIAPAAQRRVHAKVIIIGSFWAWALGAFVSAFLESPYALGAVWAVGGIFGPIFNVAFSAYRYALVPDRLLARVGSAALVVAWGAIPLGQLTAGLLLERIGAVDTMLLIAALSGAVGLTATLSRAIRTAPRAEELLSSV